MVYLVSASLIWAFSFGLIKTAASGMDPFVLGAARTGIAAIFFLPWFLKNSKIALPRRIHLQAAVCGFVQIGLMYGPYLLSFKYLQAHEVALYTMTTPLMMAILITIGTRRLSWKVILAAILATAGGFIAAGTDFVTSDVGIGILLVQLSNLLFASGVLLWTRWISHVGQQQARLMFPFFAGASLAAGLMALAFAQSWQTFSVNEWMIAIYLGVLASGLGFFLWNKGALRVGPVVLSAANNLKLPVAVIVSLTVFHEKTDLTKLISGSVLIFAAIMLTSKLDGRPTSR